MTIRSRLALCFVAAVLCHAAALFALHLRMPVALATDEGSAGATEVGLVAAAPGSEENEAIPPAAAPTPDSTPAPSPEPIPAPTPEATPEPAPVSQPSPEPQIEPSTPQPVLQPTPTPAPSQEPKLTHSRRPASIISNNASNGSMRGRTAGSGTSAGANGVATAARPRRNPPPQYPQKARHERQQGVVQVMLTIGSDGKVKNVVLAESSGFPLLDQAALEALRRWSFEPATTLAGLPVETHTIQPVRFRIED